MCWIAIAPAKELKKYLLNQQDRWLDSLWFIYNWFIHKAVFKTYKEYKTYLFKQTLWEWLALMHHRKATIWSINIENAHPFQWKHFYLMQNGTAKVFHTAHKEEHWKDVDTANLLAYIENKTSKLIEVPKILEDLTSKFLSDDFWNIIIKHNSRVLFYSDGTRDSYINIDKENNKILSISNYKLEETKWFKNKWYIIFNLNDWIIEENTFENINQTAFSRYTNYVTTYYWDDYYTKITKKWQLTIPRTNGSFSWLKDKDFPLYAIDKNAFIFSEERQNIIYFLELHRWFYLTEDINSWALLSDYLFYARFCKWTDQFKDWYWLEYCTSYFNFITWQYLTLINDY